MSEIKNEEWECYSDIGYFDQWAIKRKNNRDFNSVIHVGTEGEAKFIVERLNTRDDIDKLNNRVTYLENKIKLLKENNLISMEVCRAILCYSTVADEVIARAEPDYKLKAMQGLLDGQANVIKELEDKLEQVKLALLVEENDNQYNCAERDKLKAENARLREKNQRLMQAITFKQNECLEKLNEALAKYEDMKR